MKFVIETFELKQYKEVQDYYGYEFSCSKNKLPYGDKTCISYDSSIKNFLRYGDRPFYSENKDYGNIITFEEWKSSINKSKEVNMKYVVEVNNQAEKEAVLGFVGNKNSLAHVVKYPIAVTNTSMWGGIEYHKKEDTIKEYGPLLTFKQFSQMFGVELKPARTLKLTSDYNAKVDYTNSIVEVGCQSIPFSKVEELYKLIKE